MGVLSLGVFLLFICSTIASDNSSLVNKNIITYIDISSQLAKIKHKITIVNEVSEPIYSYLYIVDPIMKNDLAYIEAMDDKENQLPVNKVTTDDSSVRFEIVFHDPFYPGEAQNIEIYSVFTNSFESLPKTVKQYEKHFVIYRLNVFYYSLYFTEMQTLTVNAGPIDVNSVEGEVYKQASSSKDGLQYGPFFDKKPQAVYHTRIHFETKAHFLTVKTLERFIRISHWGFVTVKDKVSLKHTGPNLTGPFERSFPNGDSDTRVESLITSLPKYAFDIYLKDEIGFIYSFNVDYDNPHRVDVLIKPRFVLYGGWKTHFEIGYSLPIEYYVIFDYSVGLYHIFIPLVNILYPNMIVEEAKLNIILPEGGVYMDINPYYKIENNTKKRYCYFMDITCREVTSFTVHNLVDDHSTSVFQLTYSFRQIKLLEKPLVVAAFIYTMLLFFVILSRFSHSDPAKEKKKSANRVLQVKPVTMTTRKKQEVPVPAKQVSQTKDGKQKKNQQKQKNREKSKKR